MSPRASRAEGELMPRVAAQMQAAARTDGDVRTNTSSATKDKVHTHEFPMKGVKKHSTVQETFNFNMIPPRTIRVQTFL